MLFERGEFRAIAKQSEEGNRKQAAKEEEVLEEL